MSQNPYMGAGFMQNGAFQQKLVFRKFPKSFSSEGAGLRLPSHFGPVYFSGP